MKPTRIKSYPLTFTVDMFTVSINARRITVINQRDGTERLLTRLDPETRLAIFNALRDSTEFKRALAKEGEQ